MSNKKVSDKEIIKEIEAFKKRKKAGKEVFFEFIPLEVGYYMANLDISAKKDKLGNIYIRIKKK